VDGEHGDHALLRMAQNRPQLELPGLTGRSSGDLATVHRSAEKLGERSNRSGGASGAAGSSPDTALLLPLHRNPPCANPSRPCWAPPARLPAEPLDYGRRVGGDPRRTLLLTIILRPAGGGPCLGKPVLGASPHHREA